MLNKDNQRELAYITKIDAIEPIEGSDNCEAAVVGGWRVMVRKKTFKVGDYAVYFEIDSKVPETREYEFLKSKHYKVKTQKYTFGGKGNFISQGLLMSLKDFEHDGGAPTWLVSFWAQANIAAAAGGEIELPYFLTETLGVTYSVQEDNKRKSKTNKYTKMRARHQKLFKKNKLVQWLWERNWGKKVLFFFLGTQKDKIKTHFPTHFKYIKVTDEERIENMTWILENNEPWIKTLKIDGTSSTYILERKPFNKFEYYVLSRNVRQVTPDQKCYHNDNVYWEMEFKYHIRDFLQDILNKNPEYKYICIQGETAGIGVQGNPHELDDIYFYGFNLIDSKNGRWNSEKAKELCKEYEINWVPIIDNYYFLPKSLDEMKKDADGPCELPNSSGLREGYVYRSQDGKMSFKNVSNEFLLTKNK